MKTTKERILLMIEMLVKKRAFFEGQKFSAVKGSFDVFSEISSHESDADTDLYLCVEKDEEIEITYAVEVNEDDVIEIVNLLCSDIWINGELEAESIDLDEYYKENK